MVEKVGYRVESNHLTTSETAKNWTEKSPESKLNQINEKLDSAKSKEAKELKDLITKCEYKDFQKKIGIKAYYDLDGKLGSKTLEFFNNYLEKFEAINDIIDNTNEELNGLYNNISRKLSGEVSGEESGKESGRRISGGISSGKESGGRKSGKESGRPLGITGGKSGKKSGRLGIAGSEERAGKRSNLLDNEKINKAEKEYLSKHETLAAPEYNVIFSGKEQLSQGQLGDCYLVSGLIELANTQYFDTLMRTSIQRVKFKADNAPGYSIKVPLGEPNGRSILIKDSELNTASIRGNIGYKLLEIAYVKNRRPNNAEGNRYSPVTVWEMQGIQGGWTHEVLQTFLGRNNIGFSDFGGKNLYRSGQTLSALPQQRKTEITNYLKNFDGKIGNKFTSLATPPAPGGDSHSFNVGGNTLYNQHAYALDSVDKDSSGNIKSVNVKNPWNTNRVAGGSDTKLTLNQFFNSFAYMGVGKVKVDTFLDDKGVSYT